MTKHPRCPLCEKHHREDWTCAKAAAAKAYEDDIARDERDERDERK